MMEEGATKLGSIQENVCSIVDFVLFGFTNTIHLLMFGAPASSFISRSMHALMNFADVKAGQVSVQMKRTDFVWPSSSVCVSQD
jgi:hypothetical protein